MKFLVTIFCILAFSVAVSKSSPGPEDEERMHDIYRKCKNETQADESPKDGNAKEKEPPTSSKSQCMMGCIMREAGVIVNGKFNKEGSLKLAERYYLLQKDEMEKAKKVADICEKQVANETEECSLGNKISTCFNEESEKVGLKPVPPG